MHVLSSVTCLYSLLALNNNPQRPFRYSRQNSKGSTKPLFISSLKGAVIDTPIVEDILSRSVRYNKLLSWLRSKSDAFVSEKVEIKPSTLNCGGFGAFVSNPVEVNELLFRVPREACITLSDAFNDPQCGELLRKIVDKAGPGGNTVALAGYIAKERLTSLNQEDSNNEFSKYGPYLATLPWERGVNNQEHILYWSDDEIESLLKGTMCYNEAVDLRREVSLATKILETIISQPPKTFKLPWEKDVDPIPKDAIKGSVTAAFVCLLTRSFQDDGFENDNNDEEKLVPLLDMLQHSEDPNVSHVMLKEMNGCVEVRARHALDGGEELLNQYRSEMEENMPYHRFFTRFGFVPGIEEPILDLLRERSSIFVAQKQKFKWK